MARCTECNSTITSKDFECYICTQPVPGAKARSRRREKEPKPVTPISNLLFIASLALTLVSFLSGQRMSLWVSATLSGILLAARILADRVAAKRQSALRPVTVTRLDY